MLVESKCILNVILVSLRRKKSRLWEMKKEKIGNYSGSLLLTSIKFTFICPTIVFNRTKPYYTRIEHM